MLQFQYMELRAHQYLRSFLPIWLIHPQIPIAHNLYARVLRVGGEAPAKSP